ILASQETLRFVIGLLKSFASGASA
ncbi:hypothetical protein A2U01_0113038, partial [Trifolium medium]|nr:hypothetical protein [Trifolium medium]